MKTKVETMSIDLAKNFIQVLGVDRSGRQLFNRRISVSKLTHVVRTNMPAKIVMEACSSAHHWGRMFLGMGIETNLLSPKDVAPFRKGDKNDANDCLAIYEASMRPKIHFVPIKTENDQILQTWLRRREALVRERTQRINAIRAYLVEFGVTLPATISKFRQGVRSLMQEGPVVERVELCDILNSDVRALVDLEDQIKEFDDKIKNFAKTDKKCVALTKLSGIGPITAVALLCTCTKPNTFKNGRQFAAYLGLVPRQNSTGGKTSLGRIRKTGNTYLRTLLIHGGRSVIWSAPKRNDDLSAWALKKKQSLGLNKASVAIANKNARMAWAVMAKLAA